jgi:hypothetical protein
MTPAKSPDSWSYSKPLYFEIVDALRDIDEYGGDTEELQQHLTQKIGALAPAHPAFYHGIIAIAERLFDELNTDPQRHSIGMRLLLIVDHLAPQRLGIQHQEIEALRHKLVLRFEKAMEKLIDDAEDLRMVAGDVSIQTRPETAFHGRANFYLALSLNKILEKGGIPKAQTAIIDTVDLIRHTHSGTAVNNSAMTVVTQFYKDVSWTHTPDQQHAALVFDSTIAGKTPPESLVAKAATENFSDRLRLLPAREKRTWFKLFYQQAAQQCTTNIDFANLLKRRKKMSLVRRRKVTKVTASRPNRKPTTAGKPIATARR